MAAEPQKRTGPPHPSPRRREGAPRAAGWALALGALGVVFGDIGTSPLYALHTVFTADNGAVKPTEADVLGVISLVFWAITFIVSVKYVSLVMRADNDGEGGVMALVALVQRAALSSRRAKAVLIVLGIFGASLFYGDGMITPAISVLSAVEGLEVVSPSLEGVVVPVTLVVLVLLFGIQSFGTGAVGRLFGPVMAVWFGVLAAAGLRQVVREPSILRGLSPGYGAQFIFDHPGTAFIAMGSIVLVLTGAEALYADMGHFGRAPIRRAWFFVAFPALTLNYLGQGSLILGNRTAIDNPFFLLFPHWARVPMVLLATVATVIASQAVISGAFSLTRQAVQLGFLPRLTIRHTSREAGQIYVPVVNWGLLAAVVALVAGFGSSGRLAAAYGIAVTGTFVITTILFFIVVREVWRKPAWLVALGAVTLVTVDATFFAANLPKIFHGGWFPLAIALAIFVVLSTWQRGREIVTANRIEEEGPLRRFVDALHAGGGQVVRVPGTAVFLNANPETTPLAMRANVKHNHCLHEDVVIVSIRTENVPHVPRDERLRIDDLGYRDDGITHVGLRFGFQDDPNLPRALRMAVRRGMESDVDVREASYFLSKITIEPTRAPGMAAWRKRLFVLLSRNAASPVAYFGLPAERTITMGGIIRL